MNARAVRSSARVAGNLGLLALAAAALLVSVLNAPHAVRLLVLLAAACLVPGAALLCFLPTADPLVRVAMCVGLSLAVEALGALAMVWTGFWHPVAWAAVLGMAACISLAVDVRRGVRSSPRTFGP
ncbi:MAG TPA: hypothetical protein VGN13_06895 [Solirubrobacteraceae bacterium]|jgi:hypothetical protein